MINEATSSKKMSSMSDVAPSRQRRLSMIPVFNSTKPLPSESRRWLDGARHVAVARFAARDVIQP